MIILPTRSKESELPGSGRSCSVLHSLWSLSVPSSASASSNSGWSSRLPVPQARAAWSRTAPPSSRPSSAARSGGGRATSGRGSKHGALHGKRPESGRRRPSWPKPEPKPWQKPNQSSSPPRGSPHDVDAADSVEEHVKHGTRNHHIPDKREPGPERKPTPGRRGQDLERGQRHEKVPRLDQPGRDGGTGSPH